MRPLCRPCLPGGTFRGPTPVVPGLPGAARPVAGQPADSLRGLWQRGRRRLDRPRRVTRLRPPGSPPPNRAHTGHRSNSVPSQPEQGQRLCSRGPPRRVPGQHRYILVRMLDRLPAGIAVLLPDASRGADPCGDQAVRAFRRNPAWAGDRRARPVHAAASVWRRGRGQAQGCAEDRRISGCSRLGSAGQPVHQSGLSGVRPLRDRAQAPVSRLLRRKARLGSNPGHTAARHLTSAQPPRTATRQRNLPAAQPPGIPVTAAPGTGWHAARRGPRDNPGRRAVFPRRQTPRRPIPP